MVQVYVAHRLDQRGKDEVVGGDKGVVKCEGRSEKWLVDVERERLSSTQRRVRRGTIYPRTVQNNTALIILRPRTPSHTARPRAHWIPVISVSEPLCCGQPLGGRGPVLVPLTPRNAQ